MKYFIGIDPGKTGAWAVLDENGAHQISEINGDFRRFAALITRWANSDGKITACIENAHAMPKNGSVAIFSLGRSFGTAEGVLIALGIPFEYVSSNRWQKAVMDILPAKVPKRKDELPKETTKRCASNRKTLKEYTTSFVIRRWPELASVLCLQKNQGIADAVCIAMYALKRVAGK